LCVQTSEAEKVHYSEYPPASQGFIQVLVNGKSAVNFLWRVKFLKPETPPSVQASVHSIPSVPSNGSSEGFCKNTTDQAFLSGVRTCLSTPCCALVLPVMMITLYPSSVNAHIDKQSQKALAQFLFW